MNNVRSGGRHVGSSPHTCFVNVERGQRLLRAAQGPFSHHFLLCSLAGRQLSGCKGLLDAHLGQEGARSHPW